MQGRGELNKFIKLPFRLHQGTPWVPPLIFERRQFLNKEKNPYFQHAEAEYFLAWRDGEPVGRITAQVDRRWDQFQGGSDGQFGFIEAEDDPAIFEALLGAAEELGPRARAGPAGRARWTSPPTTSVGLLIEGYDRAPLHPRAVAPALLQGAARGARLRQDDGPAHVEPGDGRAEGGRCLRRRDPRGRRQGRVRARDHGPQHEQARPRGRDRPLHGGLQLGLGEELGLRPDHRRGGRLPGEEPEADPRPALGLHGRARRRDPRRGPHASPTSTR